MALKIENFTDDFSVARAPGYVVSGALAYFLILPLASNCLR